MLLLSLSSIIFISLMTLIFQSKSSLSLSLSLSKAQRNCMLKTLATTLVFTNINLANAVIDCNQDCVKNCIVAAPGSIEYCRSSCNDYCNQDDRHDGLSGSLDAKNGETGLFGGSIDGTVTRQDDKPPVLLNIISKETMRDLMMNKKQN